MGAKGSFLYVSAPQTKLIFAIARAFFSRTSCRDDSTVACAKPFLSTLPVSRLCHEPQTCCPCWIRKVDAQTGLSFLFSMQETPPPFKGFFQAGFEHLVRGNGFSSALFLARCGPCINCIQQGCKSDGSCNKRIKA